MAKLTTQEVLDGVVALYQAKQDLAALDEALNTQAAAIMAQAQADVAALKAAQQAARTTVMAAMQTADDLLQKGK